MKRDNYVRSFLGRTSDVLQDFDQNLKTSHAQAFLGLWAFWLSIEYLALGPYSYVLLHDFGDSFLPFYMGEERLGISSLFGGWDARIFSGLDAASNGISQFRITKLPLTILPAWAVFGLFAFAQRLIAGLFMYRMIVDVFGGRQTPAIAVAMVYAIGVQGIGAESVYGYTHNLGLGIPALPFLIWLHWRLADSRAFILSGAMFASGIVIAFATQQITAAPALLGFGLVMLAITPLKKWIGLVPSVGALGVGYFISELPGLIGIISDLSDAHRIMNPPTAPLEKMALSLSFLTRLATKSQVVPFLVVIVIFYLGGFRIFPRRLLAVFGACILILFLDPIIAATIEPPNPLANFQFYRIGFVLPFLLILIVGIGLSKVEKRGDSHSSSVLRAFLIVAIMLAAVAQDLTIKFTNLRYYAQGSNYAVLFDNPGMRQVAKEKNDQNPFRVATTESIDGTTHLLRASTPWAYGLDTVDGYVNVYPQRYRELWLQIIKSSAEILPFHYNKVRDWGSRLYIPAKSNRCRDLKISDYANLNLLSLLNVRFIVSPCHLMDSELSPYHKSQNGSGQAWHNFSDTKKLLSIFEGDFPSREIFIYENPAVIPRYFLAGSVRVFESKRETLNAMTEADIGTLRSTAFVLENDIADIKLPLPEESIGLTGSVEVVSVQRNEISLKATTDQKAMLVIGNSYNPRWSALVNGEDSKVIRTHHALQGVLVGKGQSEVKLRYNSAWMKLWRGI